MQHFFKSHGAQRAEVCLAEFTGCVRLLPDGALSDRGCAVIDDEMGALRRRIDAAQADLELSRDELGKADAALRRYLAAVAELDADERDAVIADIGAAIAEHEADTLAQDRAEAWLSDLVEASMALSGKLSDRTKTALADDAPRRALMRAISEISVMLGAMTAAERTAREEAQAAVARTYPKALSRLQADPRVTAALQSVHSAPMPTGQLRERFSEISNPDMRRVNAASGKSQHWH